MEKPIIFSTEMVRAILDGRKTQTRRVIKHPERYDNIGGCDFCCPCGKAGDRLWLRETLFRHSYLNEVGYLSTDEPVVDKRNMELSDGIAIWHWKGDILPARFLPRWASRITLEITEVRVERLWEISEENAKAEGCIGGSIRLGSHRYVFTKLWDSLNAKRGYGWETNPWVWVISFSRLS